MIRGLSPLPPDPQRAQGRHSPDTRFSSKPYGNRVQSAHLQGEASPFHCTSEAAVLIGATLRGEKAGSRLCCPESPNPKLVLAFLQSTKADLWECDGPSHRHRRWWLEWGTFWRIRQIYLGIRSISDMVFTVRCCSGVAPGLWQPDEIHLFNTKRMNSYNSEKKVTTIKQTHCSPWNHSSDFFENRFPTLDILLQFLLIFFYLANISSLLSS